MNEEIKAILEANDLRNGWSLDYGDLYNAIIQICELQKSESATEIKDLDYQCWVKIINSKNIAV